MILARLGRVAKTIAVTTLIFLLRAYQCTLRPFLFGACKFHPTCSEYGIEAVQTHGVVRGLWLTSARVLRCHPFSPGGLDPVPPLIRGAPSKR